MSKPIVCVGIVAYDGLDHQVAEDYMRLMFHLGRRCPQFDFQLAIKGKSEQFRARTAIVNVARQYGATYLWMLDDDHIIDLSLGQYPTEAYNLPIKLIAHLEEREQVGVVGALYYQRGGDYYPVVMHEQDGVPYFLHQAEISNRMQMVDVTGGGCMMIRMSIFDKLKDPWFEPEHDFGTDIQLARRTREAGYEVWCDTSLIIGHVRKEREVIVSGNIAGSWGAGISNDAIKRYGEDAQEYLGMTGEEIDLASRAYSMADMGDYDTLKEYYASKGNEQLARQVMFHSSPPMVREMEEIHTLIGKEFDTPAYGADFGCGSAPVGFELLLRGHVMDFVDVDGSGAYAFTKWRVKKTAEVGFPNVGYSLQGLYNFVMLLDAIEHIREWEDLLTEVVASLVHHGIIVTNYFRNQDFLNPEHVAMDHAAVRLHLESLGMVPVGELAWRKV